MALIDRLVQYFSKPQAEKQPVPEGLCPNCWGNQQYDKVVREMFIDKQIDVNNHETSHAFIQKFVVERVSGITLKKGTNGYECPTCKIVA
ncbi:MAG: hypothetical protein ACI9JN_001090 [Bacteroidia bacterium]|jgi:hypothetical protein